MFAAVRPLLAQFDQEHLLRFCEELSPPSQQQLVRQLQEVDYRLLERLRLGDHAAADWPSLAARAEAPPAIRLRHGNPPFAPEHARRAGQQALASGEVGVVLVAGGQGTRLGFNAPKGMFPIGPLSGSTLYRILLEKVLAVRQRYQAAVPVYLMTSPATHEATEAYLAENRYFGLPTDEVRLFCQGTMPAVDALTGKLLLSAKDSLALSPDGHGGMLAAMVRDGSLDEMARRGIRHLFYMQVDNPLVKVCDPTFLGYHLLAQSELSTLVAEKESPRDKVGNVVAIDGRLQIIEYSDLNPLEDAIVLKTNAAGQRVFWAGNTAVHAIDVSFLQRVAASDTALPFHLAQKKVPYLNEEGNLVEPDAPNAIKFERFIFDLLPEAQQAIVMEIDATTEFRPVKNAPGDLKDTPESVQAALHSLHRHWLEKAGVQLAADVRVEIGPLFAIDAEQVAERLAPPLRIDQDTFWEQWDEGTSAS